MILRPVLSRPARLEYEEAALWYEGQRPGLGGEFVEEIEHGLQQACESPQRFPRMLGDVRTVRIRRFPYSIFFRVRRDQLVVLAVFHARRDPAVWKGRTGSA